MLLNPLSLMGSSYADNSLTWSAQRTLNWLPETAEVDGTRTPIKFADIPGLRAVVDLGTGAPIRGMENVEGKLFAVSGSSLFEISTSFNATNRGNIPGVTRVSMAHNKQGGVTAANELVIANGLSGYVYNTATQSLVQITDDAFQGATTVDYVDGYITFSDPQGRFWGHSALNQATSFSSIDRYDAESAPDPIISHIVSHREVMVFGTRTTEFFRNTGAATGTFQRVDGTELEVGICAPFARARIDNSVCWVSDSLEVFRLEGHAPQRISTRPIEQMLHAVNPANVFAFAWEDKGHKVFYITAPEAFTLGFDFASGMWHERQTFDLPRWRANALVPWAGFWIVGDYANGLLYVLDWDTHHENGLELIRERASGYTHGGQNAVLAPYAELLFDTGSEDPALPTLGGGLDDGFVGDDEDFAYTANGAALVCTLESGALPGGLTLNPDCTVTGERTTEGDDSWVVKGTDAFGREVLHPDSSITLDPVTWLVQVGISPTWTGKYSGDTWTGAGNATISGQAYYSGGGIAHISNRGTPGVRYSLDYGATWNVVAGFTWSAGGGRMLTHNGYVFACGGTSAMNRRTLPAGLFAECTVDTGNSRANGIALHGSNRIVVVSIYNNQASWSLDDGVTWTLGAGTLSATYSGPPDIGSNGTTLVAAFNDGGASNLVRIKRSIDGGDTWSGALYTFTGADATKYPVDVLCDGEDWVVVTSTGQVAYSDDDGLTWSLSADNLGGPLQVAIGSLLTTPRLMAVGVGGTMHTSDNMGASWQVRTDPAGATDLNGVAWIFP